MKNEEDGKDHKDDMEAEISRTEKGRGSLAVGRAICEAVRATLSDPSLEEEGRKRARAFLNGHFTVFGGDAPTPLMPTAGGLSQTLLDKAERQRREDHDAESRSPERAAWLQRARAALLAAIEPMREDSTRFLDLQSSVLSATGADSCLDCLEVRPELFNVNDELWAAHGAGEHILCAPCLEKRMGRPLAIADLTDAPVNDLIRLGHAMALREPARAG